VSIDKGGTGLVDFHELRLLVTHSLARARRDGEPLSFVCIEITPQGPADADAVILDYANCIAEHLRASDVVGRVSTLELGILLLQSDAEQTRGVLEHLETLLVGEAGDTHAPVALAHAGVVTFDPAGQDFDAEQLLMGARIDLASGARSWRCH
jgi:GGDEF domain-containing protein